MNPVILKIGVGIFLGAAVLIVQWLRNHNRVQHSSHSRVNHGNFDGSSISICSICLQEFTNLASRQEILILPCKHKYHTECIKLVFNEAGNQKTCPLCRAQVEPSFISQII